VIWAGAAPYKLRLLFSAEKSLDPSRLEFPLVKNLFDLDTLIFLFKMTDSLDVLLTFGSTLTYLWFKLSSWVLRLSSDERLTPLERRMLEILLYTFVPIFLGGTTMFDAFKIKLSLALRLSILEPLFCLEYSFFLPASCPIDFLF